MAVAATPDGQLGISGAAEEQLAMFDLFDSGAGGVGGAGNQGDAGRGSDSCSGGWGLGAPARLALPAGGIADVAVRGDGRIAATAGWDGKVRLFSCRRRVPLGILRYHTRQVSAVAFSPDCCLLASGGRDAMVALWSVYPPQQALGSA